MMNEMTAEEAVKQIKENCYFASISEKTKQALDMAIKALEPKPMEKFDDVKTHIQRLAGDYKCWDNRLTWEEALELNRMLEAQPTDAVSREAVLMEIDKYLCGVPYEKGIDKVIKALPSVTPQRPNGKWIDFNWNDGDICRWGIKCSECHTEYKHGGEMWHNPKFCPNCGAEMSGGGEDEG